jgi:hypothetical protein
LSLDASMLVIARTPAGVAARACDISIDVF